VAIYVQLFVVTSHQIYTETPSNSKIAKIDPKIAGANVKLYTKILSCLKTYLGM